MTAEQIHLVVVITGAAEKATIEHLVAIDIEIHRNRRKQVTVYVAQYLAFAPSIVQMANRDHVPFARLKLVLNTVLHFFAFGLRAIGNDETRAHEESRVAEAFARAEPVQVGLFFFNLHTAHRIDAKPSGECEAVLVGPVAYRR